MLQKPTGFNSCDGCPLQHKGIGFCPDKLAKHPRIIFWGEAPGKNEVAQGVPFVGSAGFALREWLARPVPELQMALERDEVTYSNTLRCLPPENKQGRAYPTGHERAEAEAYCRRYDPSLQGVETIVLFGEAAQRLHFKRELEAEDAVDKQLGHDTKGVTGRVGREYTKEGIRYVFSLHPAFILRQPSLVGHGQASLRVAANTERVIEPDYVTWNTALEELR